MCLSVLSAKRDARLENGIIRSGGCEFEYEIVNNGIGYRCGYLRVLPGHPWFGKHYDAINADVHGGLTFAQHGTTCDSHPGEAEWWVGFDCAHGGDAQDPSLMKSPEDLRRAFSGETVKSSLYVLTELHKLAEQAAEMVTA